MKAKELIDTCVGCKKAAVRDQTTKHISKIINKMVSDGGYKIDEAYNLYYTKLHEKEEHFLHYALQNAIYNDKPFLRQVMGLKHEVEELNKEDEDE